ncbi:MAG TPA: choice-of-anchor D domain-containing protein [Flavobacterium sp.]|jgi:hypothetical protein
MKKRLLFLAFAFLVWSASFGQSIFTNPITGTTPNASNPYTSGQVVDANLVVSGIGRGTGISGSAANDRYNASGWNTPTIDLNDYFEFTLTPNAGYKIDFTSFVYTGQASGTGPTTVVFRSSVDGYSSNISTATVTGTTINLAAAAYQNITSAITFRIYGYAANASTGTFSINDFTFNGVVSSAGPVTVASGNWNTPSTWSTTSVPLSTDNVTIAAAHTVIVNTSIVRTGTTTVNGTLQLNTGGFASGTPFTYNSSTGTLRFNSTGNYTVDNTHVFWPATNGPVNVDVSSGGLLLNANRTVSGTFSIANGLTYGIQFPSAVLTLNGIINISAGGFFNNSPIYGPASTLNYLQITTYGRGLEWSHNGVGTIGVTPGYPNNVHLKNDAELNYNNGTPLNKAMNGNLTINPGAKFYMDYGGGPSGGTLTVKGDVINKGILALGNAVGDDLRIGGSYNGDATATFNGNGRAVYFTGNTSSITSVNPITIPYLVLAPATGSLTLASVANLTVSAPSGGNAITFSTSGDILDISGKNLTIGTTGVTNAISGNGTFRTTSSSSLTLLGTGNIGTVAFNGATPGIGTFTIDRTSGSTGCVLGSSLIVNGTLNLTNGHIDLGANTLTLNATSFLNGGSTGSYVIADASNVGAGFRRGISAIATNYFFPIGDKDTSAGGSQYTPATVNFNAGTFTTAFLKIAVNDIPEPNLIAASHLTRYWDITTTGTFTSPSYTFTGTFMPVDLVGSGQVSNQWNGTTWTNTGTAISSLALTHASTVLPAINHITAGLRDAEINIKETVSSIAYPNSSLYDFGTQLTGSTTDATFTIENTGQTNLVLSSAVVSGASYSFNPVFSTTPNIPGPSGTRTFTIRFAPVAVGTFTGSVTFANNDPSGAENPYVINFTAVGQVPSPEITIKGGTTFTQTILNGDNSPTGLDNTQWTGQNIGSSVTKSFRISNTGTANLNVSSITLAGVNPADFSISAVAPSVISHPTGTLDFSVTFTPIAAGVRSAIVTVANNDSDENPYTYMVQGTGNCLTSTNTITPTSGPVGTEITITATANNLSGATASFNGVAATVIPVDATHIKVIVPAGADSGALVTTNSQGCSATNVFTVVDNLIGTCQGGSVLPADLFISEVTDSAVGGLSYVEVYNGTGVTVNLNSYSIAIAANGNSAYQPAIAFGNVNLAAGDNFIVAVGVVGSPNSTNTCLTQTGSNGQLADVTSGAGGVNFNSAGDQASGHDHIGLFNSSALIDSWGVYGNQTWAAGLGLGDAGVDFRRKNTVTVPSVTFNLSDWDIIDWTTSCNTNDYSDIGTFDYSTATPPTVTAHPTFTPTCRSTSLSVAGSEGFAGGNALAYQWYAVAPNTAAWTALSNGGIYSGVTTSTLNISDITGLNGYQFYSQIRENGASCYSASNAVMITESQTVTWNGSWSPSAPTLLSKVVINANYSTSVNGSFEACSVTVNSGKTLTINPLQYVAIQYDLNVNGNLVVQDSGSLVMIDNSGTVTNAGSTQVIRTTKPYKKYDYTYWSSPVASANIGATFPGWRTDYSFHFTTSNYADVIAPFDGFDDNGNAWTFAGASANMTPGKGYIIMAPTTGTFPTTSTVTFSGPVNNGIVTVPMALSADTATAIDDFNLIGNPYPSAVSATDFINANPGISGTLYFWTHVTAISTSAPGPGVSNFIRDDYALFNLTGGTRASLSTPASTVPTGFIASGQGFFVEALTATNAIFNNSMRSRLHINNDFFRANNNAASIISDEIDRIWLNLYNSDGFFSQQLIGYFDSATSGFDRGYDGIVNQAPNAVSFYSFIGDDHYKIQARPSFSNSDVVPLGYSASTAGTFTIAIDNKEGQLNAAGTNIYLQDLELGIIHDLKQAPYDFTTATGTFNERFVLRYTTTTLNTDVPVQAEDIVVVVNEQVIGIKSTAMISNVTVYDIVGRKVYDSGTISDTTISIDGIASGTQAMIVRIQMQDGTMITRKVVYN